MLETRRLISNLLYNQKRGDELKTHCWIWKHMTRFDKYLVHRLSSTWYIFGSEMKQDNFQDFCSGN